MPSKIFKTGDVGEIRRGYKEKLELAAHTLPENLVRGAEPIAAEFALSYQLLLKALRDVKGSKTWSSNFQTQTEDLVSTLLTKTNEAGFKYLASLDDALVKDAFITYYHEFFNAIIEPFRDITTIEQRDKSIDDALLRATIYTKVDQAIFPYIRLLRHNE